MNRDPLRLLSEARPADLDPRLPVAEETRQAELAAAMASAVPSTEPGRAPRRAARSVRLGWGVGLVGVLAAAAVAVSVLPGEIPADGGTRGPSSGTVAPGTIALDPESLLLAAAQEAAVAPDTTGDYWKRVVSARSYARAGEGASAYTVVTTVHDENWTPNVPGGRQWFRHQNLGTVPASPQDEEVWRAQGSPTPIEVDLARGKKPGAGLTPLETVPGPVETGSSAPVGGDKVFWLGRNVSMKDLRELPADPAKLRASLLRFYTGTDTESSSVPMERDAWLFRVVSGMVTDMPLRPKVLSAAFTVLSGLEGVTSVGETTDPEGRPAVAVSALETTPNGVLEHRIYLDRARGQALASEVIVKTPAGMNAALPAGTPLTSTTVVSTTWTADHPS
ncbi:hypothetical protein EDD29_8527 [Actinocorallia herbida]|uniref:CU044_5270 family protein n=1 Tax=Actinocorallia herbida TaxID=58109 RepID=A0A3N1DCD7_9ACTN|nr:CU044_5270 family protein [Actinocorallia herbida]ROO90788.1 hypothetical protein EDD29_8527 [Actinocorallia herbida]